MKTEFTPGPWEVESGMVQTTYEYQCKSPGCGVKIPIAYMDREPDNGTMPTERDANARLIAKAPEMLELLQKAVGKWHSFGIGRKDLERVEAVIREATRS